jgi:hypothetical protein
MCHSSNIWEQNLIQEKLKKIEPSVFLSVVKNVKMRICKTIILPVVLYGCETWSLTLKEEHRPRVFESKVLRRRSATKRDDGKVEKLHNEDLHNLYSSPSIKNDQVEEHEVGGACSPNGEKRNAYRLLMGKPEGKRPLGSPRVK